MNISYWPPETGRLNGGPTRTCLLTTGTLTSPVSDTCKLTVKTSSGPSPWEVTAANACRPGGSVEDMSKLRPLIGAGGTVPEERVAIVKC